jgi:hypothetical protein
LEHQEYTIREFKDSDLQGVLSLWEHHSGWGRPGEEEYEKWMKTPYGECSVIVAEDQKKQIIGQLVFTPTELVINENIQKALKISAPIIHEDFRSSNFLDTNSLVIQLFLQSIPVLQTKNYDWIYAFPAIGWDKILRMAHRFGSSPWKTSIYDCFEITETNSINTEYKLQILDSLPTEIKGIWKHFKEGFKKKSFVTRDLKWLHYKWGDDLKIGIYNSAGTLVGYAVIKQNTGLILDFVMLNSKDIPVVINELKQLFDTLLKSKGVINPGLKFMQTDYFKKNLNGVKVKPVGFQFVFGLSALKNSDLLDPIDLNDWYVFPND